MPLLNAPYSDGFISSTCCFRISSVCSCSSCIFKAMFRTSFLSCCRKNSIMHFWNAVYTLSVSSRAGSSDACCRLKFLKSLISDTVLLSVRSWQSSSDKVSISCSFDTPKFLYSGSSSVELPPMENLDVIAMKRCVVERCSPYSFWANS